MSRYYELEDDRYHPGRWHLRSPVDEKGLELNPWQFTEGRLLEPPGFIRFPVKPDGGELDFSWASFSIPVVTRRVVQLFARLGLQEVQFIPVQVEGHVEPHFILNALRIIRCIDEARCEEVRHWKPEHGEPEKVGEYRFVRGMRIDPAKAKAARIFRPWGWTLSLVVSEDVKEAMEHEGLTGPRFTEV